MKIDEMKINISKHFEERLKERSIDLKKILFSLRERIKELRWYDNINKELCLRCHDYSIFLEVKNRQIYLITALDKYAAHIKDAIII